MNSGGGGCFFASQGCNAIMSAEGLLKNPSLFVGGAETNQLCVAEVSEILEGNQPCFFPGRHVIEAALRYQLR